MQPSLNDAVRVTGTLPDLFKVNEGSSSLVSELPLPSKSHEYDKILPAVTDSELN